MHNDIRYATTRMLADDTNITVSARCILDIQNDTANRDLENMKEWILANKLPTKIQHMLIGCDYKLVNLIFHLNWVTSILTMSTPPNHLVCSLMRDYHGQSIVIT